MTHTAHSQPVKMITVIRFAMNNELTEPRMMPYGTVTELTPEP